MLAERATAIQSFGVPTEAAATSGVKLEAIGLHVARYALVLVLVWIGSRIALAARLLATGSPP
jgi:hypothetical protein